MGCDFPLKAYLTGQKTSAGKSLLTFNPIHAVNSRSPMEIPCNNCVGCKLERSRQWAVRMMHESKFYDDNCFLTLTYSNENIPLNYSLDLRHLQLFFKKLRRSLDHKIRFYACGEYGDLFWRPHYHAIVFNHDFADKKPWEIINGKQHYISETLTKIWGHGHATTSDVTYESAAYCARYCQKKLKTNDDYGASRYFRVSPVDGVCYSVKPEFSVMSRRPGIGSAYAERFKSDFYPSGFVVVNGVKQAPPRFYLSKLTEKEQNKLKRQSRRLSLKNKPHTTTERRLARAAVRDARIARLKRTFEG